MTDVRKAPGGPATESERRLAELNEWIAWLQDWADKPPRYATEGPLEQTRGVRRLANFLRDIAYNWPPKS